MINRIERDVRQGKSLFMISEAYKRYKKPLTKLNKAELLEHSIYLQSILDVRLHMTIPPTIDKVERERFRYALSHFMMTWKKDFDKYNKPIRK